MWLTTENTILTSVFRLMVPHDSEWRNYFDDEWLEFLHCISRTLQKAFLNKYMRNLCAKCL